MSITRLQATVPAAVQLLELCAWLAPEPIPLDLFTSHCEQLPEPLLKLRPLLDQGVRFFREAGVLRRQFPGGLLVVVGLLPLAVRVDDRGQLRVALGERPGLIRVRVHVGIGQGTLKLGVLASQVT